MEWAHGFGGMAADYASALAVDAAGNSYNTGYFRFTVDFYPGLDTLALSAVDNSADTYIQKLDPDGQLIWVAQIGGPQADISRDLTIDALGNVYTTGYFRMTVDFDPGPGVFELSAVGEPDIFIQKLDASGNFIWAVSMG